ncbi:polyketide synthase [Pseudoalteromonas luteoviolacea]|uniref:polyketide synthase n=1 Tax=Pseudoalteromonas luteoviolacea TaxID=43657 RepID=UPI001B3636B5|nr:polyketide synthase [Pseudoalteromonas luteoviolacea]MBQ4839762.1 FAD-dependent monooxygenase [Pseudoalteromonas luteoviolacea]
MTKIIINSVVSIIEQNNGVVQITMEDRDNKNMFSRDILSGLMQAYKKIEENRTCKAVIITGFDSYFCSGGTQDSLLSLNDTQGNFSDVNIYSLPLECRVPVISAIQGHAIGGGFVMGLFSDIVLLSKESYYTLNFMKYGFTPGMGSTLIVPTKLGVDLGSEMLLSANQYRGDELQQRGVGLQVLPRKSVLSRAYELADLIAQKPLRSVSLLKKHLCQQVRDKLPTFIEQELAMHAQTMHQPEVTDNIKRLFGQPSSAPARASNAMDSAPSETIAHSERTESAAHRDTTAASVSEQDIAIVSVAGRFPEAENVAKFWQNLQQGMDCVIDIPEERAALFGSESAALACRWGGFIHGVDKFDPLFFKISPREAQLMDPQERLLLEEVWNLLESRGYTKQKLAQQYDHKVAVYTASMYQQYHAFDTEQDKKAMVAMSSLSSMANRISHFFDLHGPSMAVDTMCSGAASAIYLACQSLLSGACRLAIVGATNLSIHGYKYQALSQSQLLAEQSTVRGFGESGGFIPAETVGAVLLKPLRDAIQDNDEVLAVIKGVHTDHKGTTDGFNVSDPDALTRLMAGCLQTAKVTPQQIHYVETSVAGATVSDSAEIQAMKQVFCDALGNRKLPIGTVKSSIGHAEAASGLTQLIKVAMQLKHGVLTPSILHTPLNPKLDLDNAPFTIQDKLAPWTTAAEQPRSAMINTLGAGGSGCCMVLEECLTAKSATKVEGVRRDRVMVFSAQNETRLKELVTRHMEHFSTEQDIHLDDLAYTLIEGREAMPTRLSCVVNTIEQLREYLAAWLDGKAQAQVFFHDIEHTSRHASIELDVENDTELLKQAKLWVQGGQLSWVSLYGEQHSVLPQIIALPTYPFARRHCWLPKAAQKPSLNSAQQIDTPAQPALSETDIAQASDANAVQPSHQTEVAELVGETVGQILGLSRDELQLTTPLKALGVTSVTKMLIVSALCDGIEQLDEAQVGSELLQADSVSDLITVIERVQPAPAQTVGAKHMPSDLPGYISQATSSGYRFEYENSATQLLDEIDEHSVVVIGAGPAGIMAALSAVLNGVERVYLFDKRKAVDRMQMVTIYQNALPYLQRFGVLTQLIERGTPIAQHNFFYTRSDNESTRYYQKEIDEAQLATTQLTAAGTSHKSAYDEFVGESVLAISLADLQDVLLIAAREQGVRIYFNVEAKVVPTELEQASVTLTNLQLGSTSTVTPELVILADGECSSNAQAVGICYDIETSNKGEECWYIYHCRAVGDRSTLNYKFSFDAEQQLSGCAFGLFYPNRDELGVAVYSANGELPSAEQLAQRAQFFSDSQQNSVGEVLWISKPIDVQYSRASTFISKNIMLTGDASGTGSPVAGMGAVLAISAYASATDEYFKLRGRDKLAAEQAYNERQSSFVDAWQDRSCDIWSKIDNLPSSHQSTAQSAQQNLELETPL